MFYELYRMIHRFARPAYLFGYSGRSGILGDGCSLIRRRMTSIDLSRGRSLPAMIAARS